MLSPTLLTLLISLLSLVNPSLAIQDDRCPRPEAIAPCQCRTQGPTIQGKYIVLHIGAGSFSEVLFNLILVQCGSVAQYKILHRVFINKNPYGLNLFKKRQASSHMQS